jgi:hypothetical protein
LRAAQIDIVHSIRLESLPLKSVVVKHYFTQQTGEAATSEPAPLKIDLQQIGVIKATIRKSCYPVRRTPHIRLAEIHTFKMVNTTILDSAKTGVAEIGLPKSAIPNCRIPHAKIANKSIVE